MKYIIGDIGNTSTKICVLNKNFVTLKSFIFETNKVYKKKYINKLFKNFLDKNINPKILFSSVVPLALKEIKKIFKNTKFKIIEIKDLNLKKNYKNKC